MTRDIPVLGPGSRIREPPVCRTRDIPVRDAGGRIGGPLMCGFGKADTGRVRRETRPRPGSSR